MSKKYLIHEKDTFYKEGSECFFKSNAIQVEVLDDKNIDQIGFD